MASEDTKSQQKVTVTTEKDTPFTLSVEGTGGDNGKNSEVKSRGFWFAVSVVFLGGLLLYIVTKLIDCFG